MKNIFKFISVFAIIALVITSCDEAPLQKGDYDYQPQEQNLPISDSIRIFHISTDNVDVFVEASVEINAQLIDWGVICYTSAEAKAKGDIIIASAAIEDSLIYDDFEVSFSELTNGQTYYFQAFAQNKDGISYGEAIDSAFVLGEWIAFKNKASYTDDLISDLFGADAVTYDITLEAFCINGSANGKYRMVNPYGEDYPYNDDGDWDDSQNYYVTLDATVPTEVKISNGPLGIDWGYGMMGIYDFFEYGSLENGVITFPAKAIALYDDDGAYYANSRAEFRLVIPAE